MPTYNTPGVHVEETQPFRPSVTEVDTGIPAFVGYTETATKDGDDLRMKPTKVDSLTEFTTLFGGPKADAIPVSVITDPTVVDGFMATVDPRLPSTPSFILYWSVKMFFDNGGRQCYIVSTGDYAGNIEVGDDASGLLGGLGKLRLEDEPTLLVVPDAVKLDFGGYRTIVRAVLLQCGVLKDRFSILDVYAGDKKLDEYIDIGGGNKKKLVEANRAAFDTHLQYGAAYYPFVKTSINDFIAADGSNVKVTIDNEPAVTLGTLEDPNAAKSTMTIVNAVKIALKDHFIVVPPSGAVAGVYACGDAARGVWKAPANVALTTVLEPVVSIDNVIEQRLTVDPNTGKSINVIRAFPGKGTLVWGARTLLGNDNEWRYVSVRRFFMMVEESLIGSTSWAVFEPNDTQLWGKIRDTIENYLNAKWRQGALAGTTSSEAFFVRCGLGTTMTSEDILDGRLNVEIGMAPVRPAEFIILRICHNVQTGR